MSFAEDPAKFLASPATVSDKIRALDAAGYSRADIARMLGKRYQHVRNVLEADKAKMAGARIEAAAPTREPLRASNLFHLIVENGGKVQLPAAVLKAFDLKDDRVVVAELDGDVFSLISPRESLRQARAMVPQWRPGEPLWSEELIAERRREAAKDEADG